MTARNKDETAMPLYMDVHHLGEPVSVDDVAKAHLADLEHQDKYDVSTCATGSTRTGARSSVSSRRRPRTPPTSSTSEAHGLVADEVLWSGRVRDPVAAWRLGGFAPADQHSLTARGVP